MKEGSAMAQATLRILPVSTLFLLFAAISSLASAQAQQVYRYVEPDGRVVYSDKPPPANAKNAQTKRLSGNRIDTGELSYTSQLAQERYPVTFFTFDCGEVCQSAEALLNKRGVPHTKVNVGEGAGAEQLKRLTGALDAPVLQVGEDVARGFNEVKWQALLDQAGYPKTPPPRRAPALISRGPQAAEKAGSAAPAAPGAPTTPTTVPAEPTGTYPR
jgi:hypothetical protein